MIGAAIESSAAQQENIPNENIIAVPMVAEHHNPARARCRV
jgi:hypothetical protein